MRTFRMSLALAGALALSSIPTAVVAEDEPAQTSPYMSGVAQGIMIQDYENPKDCADWVLADGTTMPAPTHLSSLTGVTTLLGPTTLSASACYTLADVFENTTDGEWTMVGEDGDGLGGTYEANCIPDFSPQLAEPWECIADFEITGGTGAYESASGSIQGVATFWGTGFDEQGLMRAVPVEWRFEGIVE